MRRRLLMGKKIASVAFSSTSLTITESSSAPSISFNIKVTYSDSSTQTVASSSIKYSLKYYTTSTGTTTAASNWYSKPGSYTYVLATVTECLGETINLDTTNRLSIYVDYATAKPVSVYFVEPELYRTMTSVSGGVTIWGDEKGPMELKYSDGTTEKVRVQDFDDYMVYAAKSSYSYSYSGYSYVCPEWNAYDYEYLGCIRYDGLEPRRDVWPSGTSIRFPALIEKYGRVFWVRNEPQNGYYLGREINNKLVPVSSTLKTTNLSKIEIINTGSSADPYAWKCYNQLGT